jgi:hypothetical protein
MAGGQQDGISLSTGISIVLVNSLIHIDLVNPEPIRVYESLVIDLFRSGSPKAQLGPDPFSRDSREAISDLPEFFPVQAV